MRNGKNRRRTKNFKNFKIKKNVFDYVSLWLLIQVHQERKKRKEEKKRRGENLRAGLQVMTLYCRYIG